MSKRWNVETLKTFFDCRLSDFKVEINQRFLDADKGVSAALAAAEKAVGKAEANAEKWRENANEWRGSMNDRELRFASKDEMASELRSIRTELRGLSEARAGGEGKSQGIGAVGTVVVTGAGLVFTLMGIAGVLYAVLSK